MTVAVCLHCGAMKIGAWTPCPRCGYNPETPEDQAKHLMASDHHFDQAGLENISARIEQGLPLTFNPQQVEELATSIRNTPPLGAKARLYVFGCLAAVILVVVGVLYLLGHFTAK